jgi:hypothetical protein
VTSCGKKVYFFVRSSPVEEEASNRESREGREKKERKRRQLRKLISEFAEMQLQASEAGSNVKTDVVRSYFIS